jgi:hypothetical protein
MGGYARVKLNWRKNLGNDVSKQDVHRPKQEGTRKLEISRTVKLEDTKCASNAHEEEVLEIDTSQMRLEAVG